jgi:hypothetical protein
MHRGGGRGRGAAGLPHLHVVDVVAVDKVRDVVGERQAGALRFGRGRVSPLADLDNWHSKLSRGIGHPLIYRAVAEGAVDELVPRRAAQACQRRRPPFPPGKRPARPYKSAIANRFTVGKREGRLARPGRARTVGEVRRVPHAPGRARAAVRVRRALGRRHRAVAPGVAGVGVRVAVVLVAPVLEALARAVRRAVCRPVEGRLVLLRAAEARGPSIS